MATSFKPIWYSLAFCVLVTMVASLKELSNDGQCSRFVYEYRLMERLVKMEIEKEATQKKLAELESTCCKEARAKPVPLIALKARLAASKKAINGDRIVYDKLVSNVGNVYDTKTGVFTATVGGVYSFTVSVCLNPNNWMVFGVFLNGNQIGQWLGGDNAYHTCTSDYSTMKLDAFDKVWVQKIRGNTDDLNEDYGWNSFSANLLQAE